MGFVLAKGLFWGCNLGIFWSAKATRSNPTSKKKHHNKITYLCSLIAHPL